MQIPKLEALFVDSGPFPWQDDFDQLATEPFFTLHTSGSTGLPKTVNVTHGLVATIDAQQLLPCIDGRSISATQWAERSLYTALPPFHSAGMNFFSFSIFQGTTLILGPSDQPPSLGTVEKILDLHVATAGVMAPSLLNEVAADDVLLDKISSWDSVTFGGGPLTQQAGDTLWDRTKVLQILGSTETFNLPELVPMYKDEWPYHNFHPSLGIKFRHHQEALHELVFIRKPGAHKHQGAFWTFPDAKEYAMKDIYNEHHCKPGLWMYKGRIDDTIVLANGEKFVPNAAEDIMAHDSRVRSALVVGSGYTQPALLIEPAEEPHSESCRFEWLDAIMPTVKEANSTLPAHAQIHRSHLKILDTPHSFLRSSKGQIQRLLTANVLHDIIDEVMRAADTEESREGPELDFTSEPGLVHSIKSVLSGDDLLGKPAQADSDVFQHGFDSLKVMKLLRRLKSSIKSQGLQPARQITPKVIYEHPTPESLSRSLLGVENAAHEDSVQKNDANDDLDRMRGRFSSRVGEIRSAPAAGNAVLLTGSTGSLGSYILHALINRDDVSKVICMNRPGSTLQRQAKINLSRGLETDFAKVEFLEVDMAGSHFGLEDSVYGSLCLRVTHIIHNAWPVNFNLTLSSFEPQLEACCNLLDFARSLPGLVDIMFLSSVGVANDWPHHSAENVPEQAIDSFSVTEEMGYAQSKLLAEQLFAQGAQELNLPVTVCRLGQIAGPVTFERGMWSPNEWFPSLILGCKALQKVPQTLGAMEYMDWIPVDLLAGMLVEVLGSGTEIDDQVSNGKARYLHFVNPHRAPWSDIANSVALSLGRDTPVVEFDEWVNALECASEREQIPSDLPTLRLVDFYRHIGKAETQRPVFATEKSRNSSQGLRGLAPVTLDWIEHWLRQWENES